MARRAETALRAELRRLARENARLRAWHSDVIVRCRGMAPGLASQALNSDTWPPTTRPETTDDE